MRDTAGFSDAMTWAMDMARGLDDHCGYVGWGVAELLDGDGHTKLLIPFTNLITDVGDAYYATRGIAGVSPAAAADATKVSGMQIGTNIATAPAKNGSGSALTGTLLSGQALDGGYPQTANLGAGLGVAMVYKTTWAAGTGTGTVGEVCLVNTATLGTAASSAATMSRAQINAGTGTPKLAGDTFAVTWNHKILGS